MKTFLLLIVALSSAAAFVKPHVPCSSHGIVMRQTNIVRFMAEETTMEKEAVVGDKKTSDSAEAVEAVPQRLQKLLEEVDAAVAVVEWLLIHRPRVGFVPSGL